MSDTEPKYDLEPFMDTGGLGAFFNAARYQFSNYRWGHPYHSLRDVEASTGINKSRLSRIEANANDIRVSELMRLLSYFGMELHDVKPLLSQFEYKR